MDRDLLGEWASLIETARIEGTQIGNTPSPNAEGSPPAAKLAQAVGEDLLARWSEPARHYHTTRHLAEVLSALRELRVVEPVDDRTRLVTELAAWFHDAVYDPRAPDNEERSAVMAQEQLTSLAVDAAVVTHVTALVRATAGHEDMGATAAGRAFHDADLWILAAPADRFDQYCRQVRDEYAWVSDRDYATGRTAVLAPFAARGRLYLTRSAWRWESAARANLSRELARL